MNNLTINSQIIVDIEKMLYEGKSLCRFNGFPVFVSGGVIGDKVKIKITKINKNFAFANLIEVIEASKYRIKSNCPYSKTCGSCDWNEVQYQMQLKQKTEIVKDCIKKILNENVKVFDTIKSPSIQNYRSKIQMPFGFNKKSKRVICGYYEKKSHKLININYCPMTYDIINELIKFTKEEAQNLGITIYDEDKHKGDLRHLVFRFSKLNNNCIVTLVINSKFVHKKIKTLAYKISKCEGVNGVCINFNTRKTNVILTDKFETLYGDDFIYEKLGCFVYKVSANSFFQVNVSQAQNILEAVKKEIKNRIKEPKILDAYCGVGTFGVYLSDVAKEIVAVEQVESSVKNCIENIKLNNIKNMKVLKGDAKLQFENLKKTNKKFDVSIIDPPRSGCDVEALNNLIELTDKYIFYISCNPNTLARDLKYLSQHNFKTEYVQPFDMFVNTYHVESLAIIKKV